MPQKFAVEHRPAANTQATISQAAAGATKRNVCKAITVTFSNNASGAAAVGSTFVLRDGATGAGTVKWSGSIWLTATAGDSKNITIPVDIEGSDDTAMTLEATAAGGANTVQTVAMSGEIR